MRLTEIRIDRFGIWRDLHVPLSESGISVFYGPNEAGKSTLMRFVRGVLYGFRPPTGIEQHSATARGDAKGSLRIIHDGHEHLIRREADAGQRGRVRFDEIDWGAPSESRVQQVVRNTTESLYESIFAIGLSELQELATLDAEEVAQHIYGLSLGPEGEAILRARETFEKRRRQLLSDDRKAGELVTLAGRLEELDREVAQLGDISHKHTQLRSEQQRLTGEIESFQNRRSDLEGRLRGHRYMERVYGPWKRERQLRAERDGLPLPAPIPADGLTRFDELERQIDDQQRRRDALRQESDRLHDQADQAAGDAPHFQHECTLKRLSDYREQIRRREHRLREVQSQIETQEKQLHSRLVKLGDGWSIERLKSLPPSSSIGRLWDAAERYRSAVAKRGRSVRRYKQLVASSQRRQAEFNERLKPLGGASLSQAIHSAQQRLHDIRELSRLRIEEATLAAQTSSTGPRGVSGNRELPPLFYVLMWFFSAAGLLLFAAGLWGAWTNSVAGGNTAIVVGLIYACLGLCMAGSSWTVKQHLELYFGDPERSRLRSPYGSAGPDFVESHAEHRLTRVRQSINRLIGTNAAAPTLRIAGTVDEPAPEIDEADVLVRAAQRLVDLQALQREEQAIQERRHRLTRYREVLRGRQRTLSQCRREWCQAQSTLGLAETLKVDNALSLWEAMHDASHLSRSLNLLHAQKETEQKALEELHRQIERLMGDLPQEIAESAKSDPSQALTRLSSRIKQGDGSYDTRAQLRKQAREKRHEADAIEETLRDLVSRRAMLLAQSGVSSREELAARIQSAARYHELSRLIDELQAELRAAAETEPELAIVEEDLLAFESADNGKTLAEIEAELKQIDQRRQTCHEGLGRVKREVQDLAADRRAVSLRFEREQIAGELVRQMEAWCAIDLSIDAVDRIRHRMERHAQSETLQLASQYLARLTCGKYHNVWAPLGERHLCIDDDLEQTLRIEQLSTGTREQLFMAIRLAMIRRFAQEGTELPIVLDDVFVNFDHIRTEAAVDTILDFADEGQQILLFTCHLHLAHLFESRGIDPVWLPVNHTALEARRAG